uniref:Uncharacterized protein n=1 Tax=Anopheles christyi TaxID=43041 RepID=A0A182K9T1_9DIPT
MWRPCPDPPKPREFSCEDAGLHNTTRRKREPVLKKTSCTSPAPSVEAPECIKIKEDLCLRVQVPGCGKVKFPPKCDAPLPMRDCVKQKAPVPAFSEAYKNPFPPLPISECLFSDMDGGSITKQSLTGTSVTSTNDISLTSYDRTCDIFRLQASGQHQSSRDPPPAGTTSAVLLLDQLAAQLSDEELSSYGAAVELMLDDDDEAEAENPVEMINGNGAPDNVTLGQNGLDEELEPLLLSPVENPPLNGETDPTIVVASAGQQQPVDEEDEDELTEKQLSF